MGSCRVLLLRGGATRTSTPSSSPATTPSTRQPGGRPSELALSTWPTRCSTRAEVATEEAAREQTPGSSWATTTRLATASSASSEVSELQRSLTGFLETRVDKEIEEKKLRKKQFDCTFLYNIIKKGSFDDIKICG